MGTEGESLGSPGLVVQRQLHEGDVVEALLAVVARRSHLQQEQVFIAIVG